MSYSLDANILLYASDESSPKHARARAFLTECSADPETLCLAWSTLMAYLRISTHPRIFGRPLAPDVAQANVESLMRLPQVRVIAEEERFWTHYRRVVGDLVVRGNLVPDAHLAALLHQHDVRVLYTADVDFRKFDVLQVRNPFVE